MSIIITKKIPIKPEFLDSNIKNHIQSEIQKILKNHCTQEYGYIISIINILSFKDNYVSQTSSAIIFDVKFRAITLKPNIGDIFTCVVSIIIEEGIFAIVKNKMKVFIPSINLGKYEFNSSENIYSDGTKKIEIGNSIKIKVLNIRYEKHVFNCIGELYN